jgi:receptor protein-tyrosine kinase
LNVAVGVAIGLLLAAAIAIARTRLDRTLRSPEEAAALVGAPVTATVVKDDALVTGHVVDWVNPTRVAEDYRRLRTNLQFLRVDDPPQVIMVSSAMPAEGKTTVVINLALALAEAGHQITVVDADLRRPRLTRYLGLVGGVGLTNVLAGTAEVGDVLQKYGDGSVSVVGAGPVPPNPSELLSSTNMSKLLDELREKSGYVLIDAPPLLPVADSTGLAVLVDGVLLSVRYGKTRKDQLQQAAAALDRVGGRTLGVILNMVSPKADVASAYGYGATYTSEAPSKTD